jgi:hypothetical protein
VAGGRAGRPAQQFGHRWLGWIIDQAGQRDRRRPPHQRLGSAQQLGKQGRVGDLPVGAGEQAHRDHHGGSGVGIRLGAQPRPQPPQAGRCVPGEPGNQVRGGLPQPRIVVVHQSQQLWHLLRYGLVGGPRPGHLVLPPPWAAPGGIAGITESRWVDAVRQARPIGANRGIGQQQQEVVPVGGVGRGGKLGQKRYGGRGGRITGALVGDAGKQVRQRLLTHGEITSTQIAEQAGHIAC